MFSKILNAEPLFVVVVVVEVFSQWVIVTFTSVKDLSSSFTTDLLRKQFCASLTVFDYWRQDCKSVSIVLKHAA